jgi:hypothetical protein
VAKGGKRERRKHISPITPLPFRAPPNNIFQAREKKTKKKESEKREASRLRCSATMSYRPPLGPPPSALPPDVYESALPQQPLPPAQTHQPFVNWETAQAILYIIQERVSWAVGRPIEFDDGHVQFLHQLFIRDNMSFWTVVDQLHEVTCCARLCFVSAHHHH